MLNYPAQAEIIFSVKNKFMKNDFMMHLVIAGGVIMMFFLILKIFSISL